MDWILVHVCLFDCVSLRGTKEKKFVKHVFINTSALICLALKENCVPDKLLCEFIGVKTNSD